MRILVIDDEQPTLRMFKLLLEGMGHTVFGAGSGEQGLALFAEHKPPLVLTDIKMPGMDGIEVLRQIKEKQQHTEVIVITGHGDMDLAIQALNLDATDFINKPLRRDALASALDRAEGRIQFSRGNAAPLTISLQEGAAIISMRGVLNSSSETNLKDAFRHVEQRRENLILDFEENTSVNGAALSVLAECIRSARAANKRVAVAGVSANLRDVFEVMGVARLVNMASSLDDVQF